MTFAGCFSAGDDPSTPARDPAQFLAVRGAT